MSTLCPGLYDWRVRNGLTQSEVAGLTGLSAAYISKIEKGERQASPLTKVRIARSLGVSVHELFPSSAKSAGGFQ